MNAKMLHRVIYAPGGVVSKSLLKGLLEDMVIDASAAQELEAVAAPWLREDLA